MKKHLLSGLFLVLTFVGITYVPGVAAQTPSMPYVTPNFNYLAPCPTCTSPSYPVLSGGVSPAVSSTQQYPGASMAPCENDNAYSDNAKKKKKSKHKKHSGAISNSMEKLLKFLIELINKLLALLGGGKIELPSSGEPAPSAAAEVPAVSAPVVDVPATSPASSYPAVSTQQQNPCAEKGEGEDEPDDEPDSQPSYSPGGASPSISTTVPSGSAQNNSMDLANWKLQLPTGSQGKVDEVLQPQLASYTKAPWYMSNGGGGMRFRAAVNGVTTSGSSYPRSELREMKGSTEAAWDSSSGTHIMTIEEAITAVPKTKKHVVAGQIHDGSSDVIVIRLEMPKLFVDINGTDGPTLDANYTLGKKFSVKFEVTGGKTNIYYNGATTPAYSMTKAYSAAYFKAGAYTQSNCTTDPSDCSDNNFGEVVVYNINVTHQ